MTRRCFLSALFKVGAAAFVPVGVLKELLPVEPEITREMKRQMLISQALNTPEGRAALAAAMVEPFEESLMYKAIGRKLLMLDELPTGDKRLLR